MSDPYDGCPPEHYNFFGMSTVGLQAHKEYHERPHISVNCVVCGTPFLITELEDMLGEPKLCSQECADEYSH